jgi:hypothetical protein
MSRFLHVCCIAVLIFLTDISLEIPAKTYGPPEWFSEHCWFANWKNQPFPIDCATNVPVASYYAGHPVLGLREHDHDQFMKAIREKGCLIAGVDYYVNMMVSQLVFPPSFENYRPHTFAGSVVYVRICLVDTFFTYTILGTSREGAMQ